MSQLSILINSCDRYSDLWPVFFELFSKYWPDCPYPVYLGANEKQFNYPNLHTLRIGVDDGWAQSAQRMMEAIDSEYILILLEDFFFFRPVDTQQVASLFNAMVDLNGAYLRLKPFPPPDHIEPIHPNLGLIEPGAPYRVALQAAIWKKDVFLRLLKPGETPWQMELRGTVRSTQMPEAFFSVWKPVLYYQAGVTMGKWTPSALHFLRHENIVPNLSARPVMASDEILYRDCLRIVNRLINLTPWKIRRKIGNFLRKIGWYLPREE